MRGHLKGWLSFFWGQIISQFTKKAIVYVDGFNLFYKIKKNHSKFYRWLDLEKLIHRKIRDFVEILAIKYFTANVHSTKDDPKKSSRQKFYLDALKLKSKKIEIIIGKFKQRTVRGVLVKKGRVTDKIVEVRKYEEKESDVNIASHILRDCSKEKFDYVVLLSNDSDLKTPLYMARKEFQKKVGIISPSQDGKNSVQADLKNVSAFQEIISFEDIKESQLPDKIGKITRPGKYKK